MPPNIDLYILLDGQRKKMGRIGLLDQVKSPVKHFDAH